MANFPTRRRFLAGSVGAATFPAGRASGTIWDDNTNEPRSSSVERAIDQSRLYLRRNTSDDDSTHWDTTVRYEGTGDLRTTVFYALLTEHIWGNNDRRDDSLSYLLDQRSPGGGWDDAVTNFGALLLFDQMDEPQYESVVEDIQREINAQGHSLFGPLQDETRLSDRFRLRLLYSVLSTDHSFDELFPEELPLRIGELMALTPAFDGRAVSAHEWMSRPIYIGPLMAYFLLGASAYDRQLDQDEQRLVETAENVLLSRRLTNGAWNTVPTTIFATFALVERGYTQFNNEVGMAVDWIADNRLTDEGRVEVWRLPVWDTGLVQKALVASGTSPDTDLLEESAQWLYEAKTPQTDVPNASTELDREPAPFRRHHGRGWGYMPHVFSDWDDTAIALGTLSVLTDRDLSTAADFLRQVQNNDGSWSTYTTEYTAFDSTETRNEVRSTVGESLYQLFFDSIRSPDITGSVLSALGTQGDTVDKDRHINDAVSYLVENRAANGLWLGVWGQGYTYGTARVMEGLQAVDVDMDRNFVTAACGRLLSVQNDDGGWGETTRYTPVSSTSGTVSYQSAESTPTQTGWALQALLYGGVSSNREAVWDAVDYLLETQQADGSWSVDPVLYNFGGPRYSTEATTQAAVLRALGLYESAN